MDINFNIVTDFNLSLAHRPGSHDFVWHLYLKEKDLNNFNERGQCSFVMFNNQATASGLGKHQGPNPT